MHFDYLDDSSLVIVIDGPKPSQSTVYFGKSAVGGLQRIRYFISAKDKVSLPEVDLKFIFMNLSDAMLDNDVENKERYKYNDDSIVIIQPGFYNKNPGETNLLKQTKVKFGNEIIGYLQTVEFIADVNLEEIYLQLEIAKHSSQQEELFDNLRSLGWCNVKEYKINI